MGSYLILTLSIILWGSSVVATRIAGFSISPVMLAFFRIAIAAAAMAVIRLFSNNRERPRGKDMKLIILSGVIGITFYYIIENIGIMMTAASTASMISGSYPAITLTLGFLLSHEKITGRRVAGILVSMAGIALLSVSSGESSKLAGIGLLLLDGVFWALYNYMVQAVSPACSAFTISYYQTLAAAVCFIPFLFFERGTPLVLDQTSVMCILYLGLCCSTLAYILYNAGLRGVSAFAAATLLNLMPLSGTVLSALILHEEISLRAALGGVLIILGVILSNRSR